MANNKITTKSYFIKRLRDGGYIVDKLPISFTKEDTRRWVALVDNGCASVLVTCYNDSSFSFYDGERFIPCNLKLATDSIEIVATHLNSRGIINKHPRYGKTDK